MAYLITFNQYNIESPSYSKTRKSIKGIQKKKRKKEVKLSPFAVSIILCLRRYNRLLAMLETLVHSLGWEDPLEKKMEAHSSILAWKISWMEGPWDRKESDTAEQLRFHTSKILKMSPPNC